MVVGGVGGSGTRVVAAALVSLGYYLGSELNAPLDNLWFTFLLKRPRWYARVAGERAPISERLQILSRAMTQGLEGCEDALKQSVRGIAAKGASPNSADETRCASLLASKQPASAGLVGWGWKEPNSHVYLPHLAAQFSRLKYVHVIRHGLDMAFSTNQGQLTNWGFLFGFDAAKAQTETTPRDSLRFWLAANRRAVEIGAALLGPRFLLLNFDDLCARPRLGIEQLLRFLGRDAPAAELDRLAALVETPASSGRYRERAHAFTADDIAAVRALGFVVD